MTYKQNDVKIVTLSKNKNKTKNYKIEPFSPITETFIGVLENRIGFEMNFIYVVERFLRGHPRWMGKMNGSKSLERDLPQTPGRKDRESGKSGEGSE